MSCRHALALAELGLFLLLCGTATLVDPARGGGGGDEAPNGSGEYACRLLEFPFCDTTKTFQERVDDLISRLSVKEKIQQLASSSPGVPRLGIPSYEWWQEALHGVAISTGVNFSSGPIHAATSFPQPILTAASFNDTLFNQIGQAVSTEARALHNTGQSGLTFWSPNVNIFRDPRWGRGQETPGEDPTLTSNYAIAFVRGMQEVVDEEKYYPASSANSALNLKTSACCKHLTAYDLEKWGGVDRDHFNAVVTDQDLEDTYNPPFQTCVQEGRVSSLMCAYSRVNGIPMCGSDKFLSGAARGDWGFEGYIVSDCDAVYDMTNVPAYSKTLEHAVADSLTAGLDLNCGITYRDHAELALISGLLNESHLDAALRNLFTVQMRLGLFNGDPRSQMYGKLSVDHVCTPEHEALALEAASQGIVLLKNDNNILPLSKENIKSLALLGPSVKDNEHRMLGNYAGIPCTYITPADGFAQYVGDIRYHAGCPDTSCQEPDFGDAKAAASKADAVVIVAGLSLSQEDETLDRTTLLLPGNQEQLIASVAKVAKGPVVLVIMAGGPVDVAFAKEDPLISSILWVGYPGQAGGHALAEIIFGDRNPSGRLPMTWYPESFTAAVPMTNMNMRPNKSSGYPGRTYRFYTEVPVFRFGHGLSFSIFKYRFLSAPSELLISASCVSNLSVKVEVKNDGDRSGTTVVLLYSTPPRSGKNGVTLKTLIAYRRVHLDAGCECQISFELQPQKELSTVKVDGKRSLDVGEHLLFLDNHVLHKILVTSDDFDGASSLR